MTSRITRYIGCCLLALGIVAGASAPAFAGLDPYSVPTLTCEGSTLSSLTLLVCGGSTGAPAGVTIQWKTAADFAANGWGDGTDLCALSLSGQPSLQHPGASRWELLPGECETIKIGDINFDETGVSGSGCGLDPLVCGTEYVFRIFAHAGRGFGRSDFSGNFTCSTSPCPTSQCTFTQGYWKNHGPCGGNGNQANVWPASVMSGGMALGNIVYTAANLCTIFNEPAGGKKQLLALAHQLIAAQLNLANGATNCPTLAAFLLQANGVIGNINLIALANGSCSGGSPPAGCNPGGAGVPAPNDDLTTYNEGGLCSPNCGDGSTLKSGATPSAPSATRRSNWGKVKSIYR